MPTFPRIKRTAPIPRGPREYQAIFKPVRTSGPGEPPPGFVTITTSATEWLVYWGLSKIFKSPRDPRRPPFVGAEDGSWSYQEKVEGGREIGGAVVDFVIPTTALGNPIGFRIQTEYFHLFADPNKIQFDANQKLSIMENLIIIDIYDYQFTNDDSGQKVIQELKSALGLIQRADPLRSGTARKNR